MEFEQMVWSCMNSITPDEFGEAEYISHPTGAVLFSLTCSDHVCMRVCVCVASFSQAKVSDTVVLTKSKSLGALCSTVAQMSWGREQGGKEHLVYKSSRTFEIVSQGRHRHSSDTDNILSVGQTFLISICLKVSWCISVDSIIQISMAVPTGPY